MAPSEVTADTLAADLAKQSQKETLRFITCGSVDDGKSTLIGRLLYESKMIFEDQLASLVSDSRKFGVQDGGLDFALLVDGLAAEREQGITIDVAYRYFTKDGRNFIVADTPGHEQYTRNMATGASTAGLAIIMIDARKGVLDQTRRHAFIASLFGIRHVVLAVNKMDLVGYAKDSFDEIVADFVALNYKLGFAEIMPMPLSALQGDNIISRSEKMPWYDGPALLKHLETVEIGNGDGAALRMPVQYVIRSSQDFRGYAGRIATGSLQRGQEVKILPSGKVTVIKRILVGMDDVDTAITGQSVTVTVVGEFDISRGDMIVDLAAPPEIANQFRATIVWMSDTEMQPGRNYIIRTETANYAGRLEKPRNRVNVNDYTLVPADTLQLNDIGDCNLSVNRQMVFDAYAVNKSTGSFILIDPETNATAGAGMIKYALRRSSNVHWQGLDIEAGQRAAAKSQRACVLWFTGISGAGKTAIANILEKKLHAMSHHTMLLDGDNLRHGLNSDLGFNDADRVENIRRVSEVSKLMVEAGLITLVCLISPFEVERQMVRDMLEEGVFVEIHVDTPLAEAERRDVKGLYQKARAGKLKNFTGIDSPYEAPKAPDITISTMEIDAENAANIIIEWLRKHAYL